MEIYHLLWYNYRMNQMEKQLPTEMKKRLQKLRKERVKSTQEALSKQPPMSAEEKLEQIQRLSRLPEGKVLT